MTLFSHTGYNLSSMISISLTIVLISASISCKQNSTETNQVQSDTLLVDSIELTSVITTIDSEPAKTDSIPLHIFKKGETLWYLAGQYYRSKHYSSIIAMYNNVDAQNMQTGDTLKVPDIDYILKDESLGLSKYGQS